MEMCSYREHCICKDSPFDTPSDYSTYAVADTVADNEKSLPLQTRLQLVGLGERHGPEGRRCGAGF